MLKDAFRIKPIIRRQGPLEAALGDTSTKQKSRGRRSLRGVNVLTGFETGECDGCTICYPICSGQPSFDVEMPSHKAQRRIIHCAIPLRR